MIHMIKVLRKTKINKNSFTFNGVYILMLIWAVSNASLIKLFLLTISSPSLPTYFCSKILSTGGLLSPNTVGSMLPWLHSQLSQFRPFSR